MIAVDLKTEHLREPLGLLWERPALSWRCEGGDRQTAYQILAENRTGVIWDSGRTETGRMLAQLPVKLAARERVAWKVRLWEDDGDPGEWSQPAHFEMGIESGDWTAKWITPEEICEPEVRKPAGYLRRTFTVQTTGDARLYCTAHGLYRLYLNGKRVGEDCFTPGCDEYGDRLCYQTYDISSYLRPGENQVTAVLGDGWYRGCNGIDGVRSLFGDDLSLLCQLEIDGRPALVSDGAWEASQCGPIRMTDLELGEIYDANMEDITGWRPARVLDFGYDNLTGTEAVPVREREAFPGRSFTAPNGDIIFDFGQNMAGYTEIELEAFGGEAFTLIHGETLDENGNFTIANFQPGKRNKAGGIKQEVHYVCKPGYNTYKPSFSLFGFRYVKFVSEIPAHEVRITAHAVYSDMDKTASFGCSDKDLNQLFRSSVWSMKSNFCDIPTDCPTRERAGWTGDAGVFAPTGAMLMDSYSVFRKWLANARPGQLPDGRMPYIVPKNGPGGQISEMFSASVGWGDAAVIVPWALYRANGDRRILEENYGMMKRWVDFLVSRAKESRPGAENTPYSDYIIDTGMDYGEWNEPGANVMAAMQQAYQHGQPEVATAYLCCSSRILGEIAAILGNGQDSAHYGGVSQKAREAYVWLWKRDVCGKSTRQCEYVRPLAFGLLEGEDKALAVKELDRLVRENGYHLNTGFLSTPYLCQVLADNGCVDTAYRVLLQKDCPGWLYPVSKGATTIWETWDGVREDGTVHDSLNHYSYGAIAGWLIGGICGVRYTYEKLVLEPVISHQLTRAGASFDSPHGRIVSEWELEPESGRYTYRFVIPPNLDTDVILPGKKTIVGLAPGEHRFIL